MITEKFGPSLPVAKSARYKFPDPLKNRKPEPKEVLTVLPSSDLVSLTDPCSKKKAT